MKTPRQFLLDQHRAADARLVRIQDQVLADTLEARAEQISACQASPVPILRWIWLELIFPARRSWAGLAAVWLAIIAINLADRAHPVSAQANAKPLSPKMLVAWQAQQQVLLELMGGPETPVVDRPKQRLTPKPQTRRQSRWLAA